MLLGRISIFVYSVIPVVVNPLTASKKESRYEKLEPIKKGRHPKRDKIIHAMPQTSMLCIKSTLLWIVNLCKI